MFFEELLEKVQIVRREALEITAEVDRVVGERRERGARRADGRKFLKSISSIYPDLP